MSRSFRFDGQTIPFEEGDTVGSALHRAGVLVLSRSFKYHRPRGLYCCTGSCASCAVDVDGVPNVTACTRLASDELEVSSQNTIGGAKRDLLGVVDKVYRKGFDPHGAFTRSRLMNRAFNVGVRFMSGTGRVPSEVLPAPEPRRHQHHFDEVIVGAGLHGLRRARDVGRGVLVIEEASLGGSLRFDPGEAETARLAQEVQAMEGVTLWTSALAFGLYEKTLAVEWGGDLHEITADRFTIAPGCHDAWPLLVNNDAPGVLSLRGATRLLREHGVLPGRRVVVHGAPPPATFVDDLKAQGGEVVARGQVTAVHGCPVDRATVDERAVDCDAVICNLPGTPRLELFQQAGCELTFQNPFGGLGPRVGPGGQTSRPDVWAAFSTVTPVAPVTPEGT